MEDVFLRNLVMVTLTCYFVLIIYKSNTKLNEEKIGTMFGMINVKTVQYPQITVCIYRSRHWNNHAGYWEPSDIDWIQRMNEFPKGARKDVLHSVKYSVNTNGLALKIM